MMQIHEASQIDVSVIDLGDDERLIREGEVAAERFTRSRDHILPMARGLAAAKRKYPATRDFGAWLEGSRYSSLCAQDRAAMVKIGEHFDAHETAIVEFLAGTKLTSPQSIWTAIAAKLGLGPEVADDCSDTIGAVDIVPEPERRSPTVDSSFYLSNSTDDLADADVLADEGESESGDTKPDADPPPVEAVEAVEPKASTKSHTLYGTDKRFDLVVLTPGKDELARLRDASLDKLDECLPVRRHVEEMAAVVIAAKVTDLPVVIERLLPLCGFNRPKRILLARRPESPDVIGAKVLVTAERGDIAFRAPPEIWLDDADDPIDVAEKLYGGASSTLHLFAAAKAKKAKANERRCVIVGDESWQKLPVM
jgi:hypothetical protein